jgi:hypothetical protein
MLGVGFDQEPILYTRPIRAQLKALPLRISATSTNT